MNLKYFLTFSFFPLALIFAHEEHLPTYTIDELTITSSPLGLGVSDITQSSTVLENHELNDLRSDTIANSISLLPGISQSYYGPNANRPIIRGMDGYRVNVLENGLSAFDLSASSNDHAVTINPLLVDRIEILRGSSTQIYGSNSIGGIVNVFDSSIPNLSSGTSFNNEFRIRTSSVDDGKYSSGILFHQSGNFIFQVNGSSAKTKAYETPLFKKHGHAHNHVITYAKVGNPEIITSSVNLGAEPPIDEIKEQVANTQSDTNTYGFGASYNHDNGFIGISYSDYTSTYGVPNHEDSIVSIDREKFSLQSLYNFDSGFFDQANFQLTYGEYVHSEEAGHDEDDESTTPITYYEYHIDNGVGEFESVTHQDHSHHALFMYEGIDSKLILSNEEITHSTAMSLSLTDYDMKITGEESYLAAMNHYNTNIDESENDRITNEATRRLGIGFMHKKKLSDSLSLNGGIRYESTTRKYDAFERSNHDHGTQPESANFERDDSTKNASIGFVSKESDTITFSGNLHYSERIPETSELYSSGAHHATESFEMGNPNLENEESIGVEFALSSNQGNFNQKLTAFYNDYENFIFQSDTLQETSTGVYRLIGPIAGHGDEAAAVANEEINNAPDGFGYVLADSEVIDEFEAMTIRQYEGVEAEVYGFEYEFDYKLDSKRYLNGFADTITGNNKTEDISLPRIPPYRIGLSYHQNAGNYSFCLNAVHHGKQDNLGNGEETTDSYTFVDARLGYNHKGSELYLKINNLTDTLAYVHTSLLKESAPLPGRSFEIGYNLKF